MSKMPSAKMDRMPNDDRRPQRSFTPEFKAEVVELCRKRQGEQSVASICRDLDLTESCVKRWIAQARIDAGEKPGLTTAEHDELVALRKENRTLREERDLLKRAVSFFAKETR
jgi:transposase